MAKILIAGGAGYVGGYMTDLMVRGRGRDRLRQSDLEPRF